MANLTQVAKKADVSVATASLVLNRGKGWQRISDSCAKRVRAAADELDYASNYHMRSMRRGRADVLGLVVEADAEATLTAAQSQCLQDLMAGLGEVCQETGMDLLTIRAEPGQSPIERGVLAMREKKVDALIAPWFAAEAVDIPLKRLAQLPIIAVDPQSAPGLSVFKADHAAAMQLLLGHLAELGHRHVLWLEPGAHHARMDVRATEAAALAQQLGIQLENPRDQWPAIQSTNGELTTALSQYFSHTGSDQASAILCANAAALAAVQHALWQSPLRVPDDVSIAALPGCGHNVAQQAGITTVDLQHHAIGQAAAKLALEIIELTETQRAGKADRMQTLQPTLVQGCTTGPVLAAQP